jgi:hypothetical protein
MVMGRVGKACCAVLLIVVAANTASSEAKVLPRSPPPGLAKRLTQCLAQCLVKFLRLSCMSLSLEMPGEG